jgi:hypothetical protein
MAELELTHRKPTSSGRWDDPPPPPPPPPLFPITQLRVHADSQCQSRAEESGPPRPPSAGRPRACPRATAKRWPESGHDRRSPVTRGGTPERPPERPNLKLAPTPALVGQLLPERADSGPSGSTPTVDRAGRSWPPRVGVGPLGPELALSGRSWPGTSGPLGPTLACGRLLRGESLNAGQTAPDRLLSVTGGGS